MSAQMDRDDAALICAIAASGGVLVDGFYGAYRSTVAGNIGDAIGASRASVVLAYHAISWCFDVVGGEDEATLCGEAEALLRSGWTP